MADEFRPKAPMQPQVQPQSPRPMEAQSQGGSSKSPWIILVIIVVVLLVAGVLFRDKLFGAKNSSSVLGTSTSAYQAVFLTNGQVYFGKLSNADSDYATLTDIYYLQVVQPPLQGSQQTASSTTGGSPQISLVKLGNELHGPMDQMHIARSQILFYEDLKSDGQVVKAIEAYKANGQK